MVSKILKRVCYQQCNHPHLQTLLCQIIKDYYALRLGIAYTHILQLPNKINVTFLNVIKWELPLFIPQLLLKYILSAVLIWNRTFLHQNQQGYIAGILCNYLTL